MTNGVEMCYLIQLILFSNILLSYFILWPDDIVKKLSGIFGSESQDLLYLHWTG